MYEAILLTLCVGNDDPDSRVATPSSLEAYFINFQVIVREFQEAWHLHPSAEDRCRALPTDRQAALGEERTVTTAVVGGVRRYVGGRAILVSRTSPPSCGVLGEWSLQSSCPACEGRSTADEEHPPQDLTKREQKQREQLQLVWTNSPAHSEGIFVTTADGRSVCFRWLRSANDAGCRTPSPEGRTHVCMICLHSHRHRACPGNTCQCGSKNPKTACVIRAEVGTRSHERPTNNVQATFLEVYRSQADRSASVAVLISGSQRFGCVSSENRANILVDEEFEAS